jgi:hypothetical protein
VNEISSRPGRDLGQTERNCLPGLRVTRDAVVGRVEIGVDAQCALGDPEGIRRVRLQQGGGAKRRVKPLAATMGFRTTDAW